jgi:hypothetical protein
MTLIPRPVQKSSGILVRRKLHALSAKASLKCASMNIKDPLSSMHASHLPREFLITLFDRCKHRKNTDKAHLILRTLNEFDITYLHALLENDLKFIDEHEDLAPQFRYSPQAPCSFTDSPSAQKELCCKPNQRCFYFSDSPSSAYWHRDSGKLACGVFQQSAGNCTAKFDIYTPDDLSDCPFVVVICCNPHTHLPSHPVKTPPPLLEVFQSLLLDLDWKLADATPRKLTLDSSFISGL